jgi:stage V sporulation protein G
MMEMEVARIYKTSNSSALKAFVDIVIGQLLVKGVRIIEGKEGLFVTMPQVSGKDGKFYPTVMCLDDSLKEKLEKVVLEAYSA